jgi:hypothetical protein
MSAVAPTQTSEAGGLASAPVEDVVAAAEPAAVV